MDKILEKYLADIQKYLGAMPTSEKIDIISELKSQIIEMQSEKAMTSEQIIKHLGSPKILASSYLGENIVKDDRFTLKKLMQIVSYWGLTSFGILVVIPCLAIISIVFVGCGIFVPLAAIFYLITSFFGYKVPFVQFRYFGETLSPVSSFFISIAMSVVLVAVAIICWKGMMSYIRAVNRKASFK